MRRLLALALGLCLWAAPALAGIALISGTGGGGSQTNITFGAAATVALSPTSTIPPGSLVIVIAQNASSGGTSTGFSCVDDATGGSNTYTANQTITAVSGAATQILSSYTANNLTTSNTITCTQAGGPNGITGQIVAFSGATNSPYDSASATGTTGTGTTATVGPTGTLNGPCGAANCEVLIGATAWNSSGTVTMDANFTSIGNNSFWGNGFWIVSATTARSYAPVTTASSAFASKLQGFKAAAAPNGSSGLTTVGAGP